MNLNLNMPFVHGLLEDCRQIEIQYTKLGDRDEANRFRERADFARRKISS